MAHPRPDGSPCGFDVVATVEIDGESEVLEHGWQSWSPAGWYPAEGAGPAPRSPQGLLMGYRAAVPRWRGGFQSEALLAVERAGGSVVVTSRDPLRPACLRAWSEAGHLRVAANAEVRVEVSARPAQLALADWSADVARELAVPPLRSVPPGWCSWYCLEREVTESQVLAQLAAAGQRQLPTEMVLIDEGYEAALGDWLTERHGFGDLARLARAIRSEDRIPALWLAPFIASPQSEVARAHPEYWRPAVSAGNVWDSDLLVLDSAEPKAVSHLTETFARLCDMGFGAFKLDFLYAGVLGGGSRQAAGAEDVAGYRHVLGTVREAIGPEPYLLGCGAPLLPSIGLFDSMRVSCDVGVHWDDPAGLVDGRPAEVWYPSGNRPLRAGSARAFMHGIWWMNDPDCIMARPEMEGRDRWLEYLDALSGVALSGDLATSLDEAGLEATRRLLRPPSPEPLGHDALLTVDRLGRCAR